MLTLGYAIPIVALSALGNGCCRGLVHWVSLIVALSIAMLMPTRLLLVSTGCWLSPIAFGLGLASYATPSTDTALFEPAR
jgi:hypothetical protein